MSIVGTEDNLLTNILKLVKTTIKAEALTVEDLKKIIDGNLAFHKSLVECVDKFSDKDLSTFVFTFRKQTEKDKHNFIRLYNTLTNMYTGKSKQLENTVTFKPIYTANKTMIKILTEIRDKAETLFEDKYININNCRVSNVMVLGVLKQSDLLSDYSCTLWTEMINLVTAVPQTTLKYKIQLLQNNVDAVADTINSLCNKDDRYSFLAEQDKLKRQNNDLLLYANGVPFTKYLNLRSIPDSLNVKGFLPGGINVIGFICRVIDDFLYNRYQKHKNTHEWLLNYSAILKYELQQKDPTSPEYQKLLHIVQAYDEKITKYEQKIKEYEEGDY